MKLIVLLCVFTLVATAPAHQKSIEYPAGDVQILRFDNEISDKGYNYSYEQTDGTKQQQEGKLQNEGTDDEYIEVKGSFSWVGPDGLTYVVTYTADQEGYKPEFEQGPGGSLSPAVVASLLGG